MQEIARDGFVPTRVSSTVHHSSMSERFPARQSPTRYPEALIRTRSTVLMVSGHHEFMGGDFGLTQLVHVSADLFLVGVGYATHDRIHKFFAESGTTQYLSNGNVEKCQTLNSLLSSCME